ncbi:hypothetical protein Tco_0045762 [Tanacetum coccineum]
MAMKPKLDANLSGEPVDQTDYRTIPWTLVSKELALSNTFQMPLSGCLEYSAKALQENTVPSEKSPADVKEADCNAMFNQQRLNTWRYLQVVLNPSRRKVSSILSGELVMREVITTSRTGGSDKKNLLDTSSKLQHGRMPTKIELTLEQSQQGVSNDVLVSIEGVEELKRNVWIKGLKKEALHTT